MIKSHRTIGAILLTALTACTAATDGDDATADSQSAVVEGDVCGCTDAEAPNFNEAATHDDGTCEQYVNLYAVQVTEEGFAIEYSKNFETCAHLKDESNDLVHTHNFFCQTGSHVVVTLEREEVNVELGQNLSLHHGNNHHMHSDTVAVAAGGCTEQGATNYDPEAILYDGSCYVAGCTDAEAPNFNPEATLDDESCVPYVKLHAVQISGDQFAIEYSKNFSTCVHLKDESYQSVTDGHNHFCPSGNHVVVTLDADHPTTVELGQLVRLHHGNGHTSPSEFVAVNAGGCTDAGATNFTPESLLDDGSCYLTGDVNEDGIVNVLDIMKLVAFILGNTELTEAQQAAADMNDSGTLCVSDIILLRDLIMADGEDDTVASAPCSEYENASPWDGACWDNDTGECLCGNGDHCAQQGCDTY